MSSVEFNKKTRLAPLQSLETMDSVQLASLRSALMSYKWGKTPHGERSRHIDPLSGILQRAFELGVTDPQHLAEISGVDKSNIEQCYEGEIWLKRSHRKHISGALKGMLGMPTSFTSKYG